MVTALRHLDVRPARLSAPPASAKRSLGALLACSASLIVAIGCDGDKSKPAGEAPPTGLAVLGSDYSVTTVSLYDPSSGALVTDACVHSGGGLAQPLSGDVVLPTQRQAGGELVVIDRKNATVNFIDPTTCSPRRQVSVSTGGFKANPRDIISISANKAYVTRYETNATPTSDATDFDEGDDLLVIDPQATGTPPKLILKRIALGSYATPVAGTTVRARPDRGVFAGGKVYVTLGNLNDKVDVAAPGRVVVIDPTTDSVTSSIDFPAHIKGCSAIEHVAATNRLYVACGGSFSEENQAAGSGLVEIDLAVTPLAAKVVVSSSAVGDLPINFSYATVSGGFAFVGTFGVTDATGAVIITPDKFHAVALATGAVTTLLDGGAFNFGRAAVDAAGKKVYLPDGDAVTPRVHVFDAAVVPPVAAGTFDPNPSAHLAPREVALY